MFLSHSARLLRALERHYYKQRMEWGFGMQQQQQHHTNTTSTTSLYRLSHKDVVA